MEGDETSPLLSVTKADDGDDDPKGCGATICCDPRRPVHRYLVLIVMCFLSFGSYYCYDNPAALQDSMKRDLDINTSQFMGFYSWYSWPNVILCFFGGFLIDKVLGIRLGGIVFASFVTLGQVIFALGAIFKIYWLMIVGRFVFGIGGESLCVAQNTYAVNWFKGKELNMVFGLQLSFSRVGSTVNMNVMQRLYNYIASAFHTGISYTTLGITLMIAASFCFFSLVCALTMAFFDRRAGKILKKDAAKTGEVIHITDVKDFPVSIWLLCLICVAYYVTVFPFIGLGLVFFEMKFGLEPATANIVNSIVYILSAVASPLFGFLIDKTGFNIFWLTGGVLFTMGSHALLAFTFINPFVAMVTMGLAYSVVASALWPMIAFILPEHQLGTAYGLAQSIQNLGLAVVSIFAGLIVDAKGYLVLEVFNLMWLCVCLFACAILYLLDASKGGVLNRSASKRRRIAAEEKGDLLDDTT